MAGASAERYAPVLIAMDKYHTNRPPPGEPIVNPMVNPSTLAAAQQAAKSTADRYFGTTVLPPNQMQAPEPKPTGTPTMSKLDELVSALTDIPKQVDEAATDALTRLTAARDKAQNGIGKINDITAKIEQTADTIDSFTNRLSNNPPT